METRLEIKGMTCGHCVSAVEKALAGVPGVAKVIDVSKDRGEALVEGEAEPEKLIEAITGEGYEAKVA
ncbi:MAG: heavy-metal-associated domain-containing protein [Proteobacteria bacterium]|nr:heavy-metal-associated domain-containing protein [Pseudomonadota bacterium]